MVGRAWCRLGGPSGAGWPVTAVVFVGSSRRLGRRDRRHLDDRPAVLGVDQFGQPSHLALHRLETVALQLEGVAVESFPGSLDRGLGAARAAPPAGSGGPRGCASARRGRSGRRTRGARRTSRPPRTRPGVVEQLLEVLLALGGELVDDLAAPAGPVRRRGAPGMSAPPSSGSSVISPRASICLRQG